MAKTESVGSAGRVLDVLNLLLQANVTIGMAPSEIARELRLHPSAVTRYVATLTEGGWVERIAETGHLRPSVRFCRFAVHVATCLHSAERRIAELRDRIATPLDTDQEPADGTPAQTRPH